MGDTSTFREVLVGGLVVCGRTMALPRGEKADDSADDDRSDARTHIARAVCGRCSLNDHPKLAPPAACVLWGLRMTKKADLARGLEGLRAVLGGRARKFCWVCGRGGGQARGGGVRRAD